LKRVALVALIHSLCFSSICLAFSLDNYKDVVFRVHESNDPSVGAAFARLKSKGIFTVDASPTPVPPRQEIVNRVHATSDPADKTACELLKAKHIFDGLPDTIEALSFDENEAILAAQRAIEQVNLGLKNAARWYAASNKAYDPWSQSYYWSQYEALIAYVTRSLAKADTERQKVKHLQHPSYLAVCQALSSARQDYHTWVTTKTPPR
jgi:hypothetical protein